MQFSAADADNDGVLSRDEFIEFASYLDAVASALGGSHVDVGGDNEPLACVAKGTGGRGGRNSANSLLDDRGRSNMDLFDRFDVNQDQRLDVDEAVALLQARPVGVAAAPAAAEQQ